MSGDYTSELKHKDWNPYLYSVNDDLNILNSLMPRCYDLGKWYTKDAAINLQTFYMSRATFIRLPNVIKKINNIVRQFHDPIFIKDYTEKTSNALTFELDAINILFICLSQITERLSENEIIPVVKYKKNKFVDEDYLGGAI